MLQWMGGSRRKIKTTKRCIQNRQQQYFAQRKRHSKVEGTKEDDTAVMTSVECNHVKSLDVTSLMDIYLEAHGSRHATTVVIGDAKQISKQREPCLTPHGAFDNDGHEGVEGDRDEMKNNPQKVDAETQWTPYLGTQITDSSKHANLSDQNHVDSIQDMHENKDSSQNADLPHKKFSIIDVIGEKNRISPRSPVEVYAAFAIEGVGEIESQTPITVQKVQKKGSMITRNYKDTSIQEKMTFEFGQPNWSFQDLATIWQDSEEPSLKEDFTFCTIPTGMPNGTPLWNSKMMDDWQTLAEQSETCPHNHSINFSRAIGKNKDDIYIVSLMDNPDEHHLDGSSENIDPFVDILFPGRNAIKSHIGHVDTNFYNNTWNGVEENAAFSLEDCVPAPCAEITENMFTVHGIGIPMSKGNVLCKSTTKEVFCHSALDKGKMTDSYNRSVSDLDWSTSSNSRLYCLVDLGNTNGYNIWDSLSDESCASSQQINPWSDNPATNNFQRKGKRQSPASFNVSKPSCSENSFPEVNGIDSWRMLEPVQIHRQIECESQRDSCPKLFVNHISSPGTFSESSVTDPCRQEEFCKIQPTPRNINLSSEICPQNITARAKPCRRASNKPSSLSLGNFEVDLELRIPNLLCPSDLSKFNSSEKFESVMTMREKSSHTRSMDMKYESDQRERKIALQNPGRTRDNESSNQQCEKQLPKETSFMLERAATDAQSFESEARKDDPEHLEDGVRRPELCESVQETNNGEETMPHSQDPDLARGVIVNKETKSQPPVNSVHEPVAVEMSDSSDKRKEKTSFIKGNMEGMANKDDLEYKAMLESYVLQLLCINKALKRN